MPNLKFSQFQEQTDPANVQFVVGYNGTDNVRITPGNLGGYPFLIDTASLYSGFVPSGLSGNPQGNTVLGISASSSATTGVNNTALGYEALSGNTTGGYNTAVGNNALSATGILNYNTAVGNAAGRLTTGTFNTFLGEQAGEAVTSGQDNVFLGALAGYQNTSTTSNSILIGYNTNTSPVGQSNFIVLGNSSHTTLQVPGIQSGASNGDVLTYNSTTDSLELAAAGGGGATDINGLSDCTVTLNTNGDNYFIGTSPGTTGTAVYGVTAIGDEAGNAIDLSNSLNSINSTFVGSRAGKAVTSPYQGGVTAIGAYAGSSSTSGSAWTCVGSGAGQVQQHNGTTIIGFQAGWGGTSTEGVIIGKYAQQSGTGSRSISIGRYANRTSSATGTISIGWDAGYSNTTGASNTNLGYQAGYQNTTGFRRTHLGYESGRYNSGSYNTGVGYRACNGFFSFGTGQGTGEHNTAVGNGSMSALNGTGAANNTAVGSGSLSGVLTGGNNTAIGRLAGGSITSGSNLTVIGYDADASSATATNEITLGNASVTSLRIPGLQSSASDGDVLTFSSSTGNITLQAAGGGGATDLNGLSDCLVNVTAETMYIGDIPSGLSGTPTRNTTLGILSGEDITSGFNNTLYGYGSGKGIVDSTDNTMVGKLAGSAALYNFGSKNRNCYFGSVSGNSNTGGRNVGVGYQGLMVGSGSYNVAVGYSAGSSGNNGTNNTMIGYNAESSSQTVNNEITLGNSSVTALRCAVTSITSLSDERDKSEIKDLEYGLAFIDALQPREFVWDNRPEIRTDFDEDGNEIEIEFYSANKGKKDFGFIAQEVQELDNDTLRLVYAENEEKLEMSYGKLVPILVKAIQDLSAKVTALENA